MPTERNERETLLAVATAEGWWRWMGEEYIHAEGCLFCNAYRGICGACRHGYHDLHSCRTNADGTFRTDEEMIAAGKVRLQRAGIWED